jgi:hypothetical protein
MIGIILAIGLCKFKSTACPHPDGTSPQPCHLPHHPLDCQQPEGRQVQGRLTATHRGRLHILHTGPTM